MAWDVQRSFYARGDTKLWYDPKRLTVILISMSNDIYSVANQMKLLSSVKRMNKV
jgi:hypothetical protein